MAAMITESSIYAGRGMPAGLVSLARRFQAWRSARRLGKRIPAPLWRAAVAQARVHGLSATATALKLSYCDLQRRLGAEPPGSTVRGSALFVEASAMPLPPAGVDRGGVEVLRSDGTRLILRLPAGAGSSDLLPIVEMFLRPSR
jgi:hypothetical protein